MAFMFRFVTFLTAASSFAAAATRGIAASASSRKKAKIERGTIGEKAILPMAAH